MLCPQSYPLLDECLRLISNSLKSQTDHVCLNRTQAFANSQPYIIDINNMFLGCTVRLTKP